MQENTECTLANKKKIVHAINSRLKNLVRKELVWLSQQTSVSASSAEIASKLLHSHSYKATVVSETNNMIRAASVKFSKLYLHAVDETAVYPTFIPFGNEVFRGKSPVLHEVFTIALKKLMYCVLRLQLGL